ncbi:hypothetical protein QBC39DRAFT_329503 [Podospora conica]|nr:hypothetical protein QBC39DRAFT_329503 [Schizothecium conicum]
MAPSRKRPREEKDENAADEGRAEESRMEDNRAECRFSIRIINPKDRENETKRRRTEGLPDDEVNQHIGIQLSPFSPTGKFKKNPSMDLHYLVEPCQEWAQMTRYNSFVLNNVKYFSEGFIYVANDSSMQRERANGNKEPIKKSDDDWVARILEIRAKDEHHVYARVYWMYWPDELPRGSRDGKKKVSGRQPYHGTNELIASNHMDIINVVSVTSQATVKQWFEENDDEIQTTLYWRQAFDVRAYELSSVELVCSCNTPAHPDNLLVGCTTENCKRWLHEQCIKDQALRATWARLGADKPHRAPESDKAKDLAIRPLSPKETGAAVTAQHSIDVKADDEKDSIKTDPTDNVDVKHSEDDETPGTPDKTTVSMIPPVSPSEEGRAASEDTTKMSLVRSGSMRKAGRPRKSGNWTGGKRGRNAKPWLGLFEVSMKMADQGPPLLEFRDLREGIEGGEKTWTEPVKCLVCGNNVN